MAFGLKRLKIGVSWSLLSHLGTALDTPIDKIDASDRTDRPSFCDERSKTAWEMEKIKRFQCCSQVKQHVVKQAK